MKISDHPPYPPQGGGLEARKLLITACGVAPWGTLAALLPSVATPGAAALCGAPVWVQLTQIQSAPGAPEARAATPLAPASTSIPHHPAEKNVLNLFRFRSSAMP